MEKNEEENKKLKQQILEQQKLKRDLENRLQKDQAQNSNFQQQRQARISKSILNNNNNNNNKALNKKEYSVKQTDQVHITRLTSEMNRPAFATTHFKPLYCKLYINDFFIIQYFINL